MKVEIRCGASICGVTENPEACEYCIACSDLIMEPLKDSEAPLSVLLNDGVMKQLFEEEIDRLNETRNILKG